MFSSGSRLCKIAFRMPNIISLTLIPMWKKKRTKRQDECSEASGVGKLECPVSWSPLSPSDNPRTPLGGTLVFRELLETGNQERLIRTARARWGQAPEALPCYLVTAGHGEQPLPLQHPVPGLDAGVGAHRDCPFTRLYFCP